MISQVVSEFMAKIEQLAPADQNQVLAEVKEQLKAKRFVELEAAKEEAESAKQKAKELREAMRNMGSSRTHTTQM